MKADFTVTYGAAGAVAFEGAIDSKPLPRTEAAASCWNASRLSLMHAKALQAAGVAAGYEGAFATEEIIVATWFWSPKDEGNVLSIVTRGDDGIFRSWFAIPTGG